MQGCQVEIFEHTDCHAVRTHIASTQRFDAYSYACMCSLVSNGDFIYLNLKEHFFYILPLSLSPSLPLSLSPSLTPS